MLSLQIANKIFVPQGNDVVGHSSLAQATPPKVVVWEYDRLPKVKFFFSPPPLSFFVQQGFLSYFYFLGFFPILVKKEKLPSPPPAKCSKDVSAKKVRDSFHTILVLNLILLG